MNTEFYISVLVIVITVGVNLGKTKDYTGWLCVDCLHLRQSMRYKSKSSANFLLIVFNPVHHKISLPILHTVFFTHFFKVITRIICLTNKSTFSWWSFPLFFWPQCVIQGWYCEEKLHASHSQSSNGLWFKSIDGKTSSEDSQQKSLLVTNF